MSSREQLVRVRVHLVLPRHVCELIVLYLTLCSLPNTMSIIDKCVSVTGRGSSISGQGGRDCAAKKREDGETAGPPGATNPQAAAGRPHLADDREGVRGHDRAGHHRPGERRPGHVLCPLRRQGDAPGQPARGPAGHADAATATSTYDARRTTRARSWLQSRDAGA